MADPTHRTSLTHPEPASPRRGWAVVFGLLDGITQVFNVAGTVLIVGLMVLIGADVFGRQAFNTPIAGVPEMVAMSIVAIVFLQVPQALRSGRLTRSDALLKLVWRKRPRLARGMEIVFDAIAIAILGALLYAAWPTFVQDWERDTFVGAMGDFTMPVWPVKLILVVGTALLIAQFLARLIKLATGQSRGEAQ